MYRIASYLAVFTATVSLAGCTHIQLRRNTVRQALTVGDIQQQQVLNNLAMFVYDPNSLPSFSYPNQSSSNITDSGTASMTPGMGRSNSPFNFFWLTSFTAAFSGERQMAEAFTLNPVNDPRKLELMRCAYQKAVANCGAGRMAEACPDCKTIQQKFYTGDPNNPEIAEAANGIVTSECLGPKSCWFHYGPKKCLPKHCDCLPVGHYCGTYVWVTEEGRDELTKLTIAILDYAQNAPPSPLTKTVSYYIDEYGLPTTSSTSVGQVSASVQINELPSALMNMGVTTPDEVRIKQIVSARLLQVNLQLADLEQKLNDKKARSAGPAGGQQAPAPAAGNQTNGGKSGTGVTDPDSAKYTALLAEKQSLESKLTYLGEQLRIEGLKHPYAPVGPPPAVPSSILPFQLQQQALGVTAPATH